MEKNREEPRPGDDRGKTTVKYNSTISLFGDIVNMKHVSDCQQATKQTAAGNAGHCPYSGQQLHVSYTASLSSSSFTVEVLR